ncbi:MULTISPECIES: hypothetical protein [Pseudomonas]|uniref:hypothetical protein n=1 Tax=Pseudomonas TaxID=286 RepID=UPI0007616A45|nr:MULTISPECIES: hypothetical protein [Pseudomonas]QDR67824.1 hypothetical protein FPB55_09200 [Pseudomonas sp. BJP69]WBM34769.1 hypothetical protein M2J80_10020 [Pseudomonas sp. NY11382]WHL26600.1 hypothetical protein QJS63_17815 [Pseudomonas juntendi]
MRNGTIGLVSAISLFLSFSAAAGTNWISLGSTNDGLKWEGKPGSFEFTTTKNKAAVALIAGRVVNSKTSDIQLYKWYVSVADCNNNMGKLVSLSVGGEYEFDSDFMFGSGNVSSSIAEFICAVADDSIKKASGKSL